MSDQDYVTDDNAVEFAETREQVESLTSNRHAEISSGTAIDVLSPYAKAYLGLYLDIDNRNDPETRVRLLASDELSECIFEGFCAATRLDSLPSTELLAEYMVDKNRHPMGFVILAGMHYQQQHGIDVLAELTDRNLAIAFCFHYANKSNLPAPWAEQLLHDRHDLVAPVLNTIWITLARNNIRYMPALARCIDDEKTAPVLHDNLIPLLEHWQHARDKELRQLLLTALCHASHKDLLELAKQLLTPDDNLTIKKRVLWLATAFLLDPEHYNFILSDYCGQLRQKILPLLDFTVEALNKQNHCHLKLSASGLAHLIRIIAPHFPRVEHLHGEMDDVSRKVMWLFDQLKNYPDAGERIAAVTQLRKVRVMRIYADVLKDIERSM